MKTDAQFSLFQAESRQSLFNREKPREIVRELLHTLKREREREVLTKRYGLSGGSRQILESIGKEYHITRERVRQIEKSALTKLRREKAATKAANDELRAYLINRGGVAPQIELLSDLLTEDLPADRAALTFLIELSDDIYDLDIEKVTKPSWAVTELPEEAVKEIVAAYEGELARSNRTLSSYELVSVAAKQYPKLAKDSGLGLKLFEAVLSVAEPIMAVGKDSFGLASWRHINPRSIRDKTFYIVKRIGKPMHFTAIASEIEKLNFDRRKVTKQAVHNELIRDPRFVLVGRGIYALAEWGYKPGTVADIIVDVLREAARPLPKREIVKLVLKHRQVKETTVILNLQNRDRFLRVDKAVYTLSDGGK